MNDEARYCPFLLQRHVAVILRHVREPSPDGRVVLLLVHGGGLTSIHGCLARTPYTAGDVWEWEEADVVRANHVHRGGGVIAQLPTAHIEHSSFALQEQIHCRLVIERCYAAAEVALLAQIGNHLRCLNITRVGQLCLTTLHAVHGTGAELAEQVAADQAGDRPPLLTRSRQWLDALLLQAGCNLDQLVPGIRWLKAV